MNKKIIAIYPGSFNPFHKGHQNILEKAERIFGEGNVIISVGVNPDKQTNTVDDLRVESIRKQLPSKNVEGYSGFLTEYVRLKKEQTGKEVVVIRGLRNGHDFDYEYNQLRFMWDQMPDLNIICLFADPVYMHVSSSAYRALEKVKPGSGHKYLAVDKVPTAEMIESKMSAVVVLDEQNPDMLNKYEIVPFESAKDYIFKGIYSKCLEFIKNREKESRLNI